MIAKCISAMDNVVLLSEVHPSAMRRHHPLHQSIMWYGLPTPAGLDDLLSGPANFTACAEAIAKAARAKGRSLVIRDWTHLDYTGVPYIVPSLRLRTAEALSQGNTVHQGCTVRHPIAQWRSLRRLAIMNQAGLTVPTFFVGYREFAKVAARIGFIRYEDFCEAPDRELGRLCEMLRIDFDPGYRDRWHTIRNMTGDVLVDQGAEIKPARPIVDPHLEAEFRALPDYAETLALLGYEA